MDSSVVVVAAAAALLSLLSTVVQLSHGYRHVIFMHGLLAGREEIKYFEKSVAECHPGTNITFIDKFKYLKSFDPLWRQVGEIRPEMMKVMSENPDGVHLVCFSQGGLICRGVLETLPSHNVVNFISLSAPQGGQYGTTAYLAPLLPKYLTKDYYKLFYTKLGQRWSIANYWNDPHRQKLFFHWSNFLAVVNNQSTTNTSFSPAFRKSFLRLKNLVLVGGPDDGVITPWQSSQFAVFDDEEKVVEMKHQLLYREDYIGLQTLDRRSSLHLCTVPGVHHTHWHRNLTAFEKCIKQWLD